VIATKNRVFQHNPPEADIRERLKCRRRYTAKCRSKSRRTIDGNFHLLGIAVRGGEPPETHTRSDAHPNGAKRAAAFDYLAAEYRRVADTMCSG